MSLRKSQSKFVEMVALLIIYANSKCYEITFGDAFATTGHSDNSFHYKRLAIDLNLFLNDKYLTSTDDHKILGEFWESIGGTWGGRFKNPDGNHYSFGE